MMSDSHYRQRWEKKKSTYAKHGIIEGENLIVSLEEGSFDSGIIKGLINKFLS